MRMSDRLNNSEFVYAFGDELIYMSFIVRLGASESTVDTRIEHVFFIFRNVEITFKLHHFQ